MPTFAQLLREAIRTKDISARVLAEKVPGLTHSTLNRWLNGQGEPTVSQLVKLAEALGVPPESLLPTSD